GYPTFEGNELYILEYLDGYVVRGIYDEAFIDFKQITKISMGEGLYYIGKRAFANLSLVNEIELPMSLKFIDQEAFYNMPLKSLIIYNAVLSDGALLGLNELNDLETGRITSLRQIFGHNILQSLEHLNITNEESFSNLSGAINLKSIEISNVLQYLGSSVFNGLTSIEKLTLPFVGKQRYDIEYYRHGMLSYNFGGFNQNPLNGGVPVSLKEIYITD